MKKSFVSLLMLSLGFLTVQSAFAQSSGKAFYDTPYKSRNSGSFSANTSILSLGYGFPNVAAPNHWRNSFGPAYVKYEHGILDEVGIGGYLSFAGTRDHDDHGRDHNNMTAFSMGILGYYHFNKLIPLKQLDVYAGAGLGFRVRSYNYHNENDYTDADPLGLFKVGARWYFTPGFGVYAEGGYDGMSDVNLGVTFRF